MSSPMKVIVRGRIYWADKRFSRPGVYLWTGKNHVRLIPWFKGKWSIR